MQPLLRLLVRTFVHFWAILTGVLCGLFQPPTNYATITTGHVSCNLLLLSRGLRKFTSNLGAIPERHKGDIKHTGGTRMLGVTVTKFSRHGDLARGICAPLH